MAKRRKFDAEFKAEVVLQVLTGMKSQAAVCREHQLSPFTAPDANCEKFSCEPGEPAYYWWLNPSTGQYQRITHRNS